MEGDVGGIDWDGPGEELDEERELVNGGNAPLLSLKGTMSQINSIRHMCTYIMYYACLCQLQKVCHVLHLLSIESQLFQFSPWIRGCQCRVVNCRRVFPWGFPCWC